MTSFFVSYFKSPIGIIEIVSDGEFLIRINKVERIGQENSCVLNERCKKELQEYFDGTRTIFEFPLKVDGSDYQKKVWKALEHISYGKTCTYKDIAIQIGNPKSVRAVGGAIHKNPFLIVIPCHRVIGKDGSLVGFAHGIEMKEKLLTLESQNMTKVS